MAGDMSLLEFVLHLLGNDAARANFAHDPQGELHDQGLADLSPQDVYDALVLVEDTQTADFSRHYDTGADSVSYTPPVEPTFADGSDHDAAVRYLNRYVTNNYVDDRDTITDSSVNQQIDTGGGDFDQDIDIDSVVASGDGAVAAGDDIDGSTIVTGDDNQVGDGNVKGDGNVVGDDNQAVTGDDNTTSFGRGDATSADVGGGVTIGDGAAFASGGDAEVDNSDWSVDDSWGDVRDSSVDDSFHDYSDNSVHDSGNTVVDASTEDSGNTHVDHGIDDSFTGNRDASDNSASDSFVD